MHSFFLTLAILNLLAAAGMLFLAARGARKVRYLANLTPPAPPEWPKVSLIVPARNEERDIEAGLRSLLQQDYPELEILGIDDRSTDGTGEILDRIAEETPRLRVVHIKELPPGWLGKNHALQRGAEMADGKWLLFADADVVMDANSIRRAVAYAEAESLDHLAISPEIRVPGWWLRAFVLYVAGIGWSLMRPWQARNPNSRVSVGVGAFNLVRADSFQAVEGMRRIALRPDDDLKLGQLLKHHGSRQELLNGVGMLHVPWYANLNEAIRGLEKNSFAVLEYRIFAVALVTLLMLAVDVWPFLAVFFVRGPARWILLAAIPLLLARGWVMAGVAGLPWVAAFGHPLAAVLAVYVHWRATILCLVRGGIRWRETHYSLSELKTNRL